MTKATVLKAIEESTHANKDNKFQLSDGTYGNPGCDFCGTNDAYVKSYDQYYCKSSWIAQLRAL